MSKPNRPRFSRTAGIVATIAVVAVAGFVLTRSIPGVWWRIVYVGMVLLVLINIAVGERDGLYDRATRWLRRFRQ